MEFSTPEKRYVVFEGIDGAGTTTQWNLLVEWLRSEGLDVMAVREPSQGPIGQLLRRYLGGEGHADQAVLARLFAADRFELMTKPEGIRERLAAGAWVVSDRSFLSSLAYQSIDLPFREVVQLNRGVLLPSLVFFLDVPPSIGMSRVQNRERTREIFERLDLQRRVQRSYFRALRYADRFGVRVVRLSGQEDVQHLHETIKEEVQRNR